MGTVTSIVEGINERMSVTLPNYSKLAYQVDIADNKFKGNSLGFSVLPSPALEVEGLIQSFSLDQQFKLTFTNSYNAGARSQLGDALKVQRIQELMDDMLVIYKDLVNNKYSIDVNILLISDLQIEAPEFIEEEKTILVSCLIKIKYKTNL